MKKIIPIALMLLTVGGGAFYGGTKFAAGKSNGTRANFAAGNFQGGQRTQGNARGGAQGGFVNGDIIGKDDKSITVKLRDGGSTIIFFSDSTEIGKFVTGTSADLEVGKTVMVTGQTNTDGSVSAKSIQLRPPVAVPQQPATK
jgi:hypothetical protein